MKTTELRPSVDPPDIDQKPYFLVQLPELIILDILSKIPLKTLIQCRCVCKSWRSLFSHPRFAKDLFSGSPHYYLVSDHIYSDRYFLLNFNDTASTPNVLAALKTISVDIVGSCNGFFCLYNKQLHRPGFYISNPITGESLPLPKPTKQVGHSLARPRPIEEIFYERCCAFGFGFSPIGDVYKLFLFTSTSTFVQFTPGRGCVHGSGPRQMTVLTVGSWSWRHIGDSVTCDFEQKSGIYLNGYLHWIGLPAKGSPFPKGSRFLYALDIESECFQQLPLPPWTWDDDKTKYDLSVLNGCLSITVLGFNITVWVMKDYGVKESWTKDLDITVDYGLGFESSAQVLNFSKERHVFLFQNKLQAHITGSTGFVGVEVNGIPSSIDAAFVYIPSFVSLIDVIRGQNSKSRRLKKLRTREAGELEPPAPNETKLRRTCKSKDQSVRSQQASTVGQENVQTDAADQGNLQYGANGLNQGNVQYSSYLYQLK